MTSDDFTLEYATPERTDSSRAQFLAELARAAPTDLCDWDHEFIQDNNGRRVFSPAQRREIDRLISRFKDLI